MTAAGETLAKAEKIQHGWRLSELISRSRSTGTTTHWNPSTLIASPPDATVDALFASAHVVAMSQASSFEVPGLEFAWFHEDVEQTIRREISVEPNQVTHTSTENEEFVGRSSVDVSGRTLRKTDAAGTATRYRYDAMGRLRAVILADGTTHTVDYDDYGRPWRIHRDGIASVIYKYAPVTGLLQERIYSAPGTADGGQRSEVYAYDLQGRIIATTHTNLRTWKTQVFRSFYDGATPNEPQRRGAFGFLTATDGDGFTKIWTHRPDGKVSTQTLTLEGWRVVTSAASYADDGAVRSRDILISDARGTPLHHVHETMLRDAYGRSIGSERDGHRFLTLTYGTLGLPNYAEFGGPLADRQSVTFNHDPYTHARIGVNQYSSQWASATSHQMNARGHIAYEHISLPDATLKREYQYSAEGYLNQSLDAHGRSIYEYDALGLPATITTDVSGLDQTRKFARQGSLLAAGDHYHRFDALGRAVERDDVQLEYGPNGQVARGQRGEKVWEYLYDEGGLRIAKRVDGEFVAGYLEGGSYLDATSLIESVRVVGVTVGVVKYGTSGDAKFHTIATDVRGTALTDIDGTTRIASPFGDRATRPDMSVALDYATQGYDPDLGTVRMGVRDYDPILGRYLTPDPLFFEQLDKCVENPVSCNLYAYARNNPIVFIDPSGTEEFNPLAFAAPSWERMFRLFASEHKDALEKIDTGSKILAGGSLILATGGVAEVVLESAVVVETGITLAVEYPTLTATTIAAANALSEGGPNPRVFYCGGRFASAAAAAHARSIGGVTIEMTPAGQALQAATATMSRDAARPYWEILSQGFAAGAKGRADSFIGGVWSNTVWGTIERSTLTSSPDVSGIRVYLVVIPGD